MKRLVCFFVLTALLIVTTGFAPAEDEKQPPKGKGKAGLRANPEQMLKELDKDKDKALSEKEFLAMADIIAKRAKESGREVSAEQIKGFLTQAFKRMDANGDGKVTLDEMKKASEARPGLDKGKRKDKGKKKTDL